MGRKRLADESSRMGIRWCVIGLHTWTHLVDEGLADAFVHPVVGSIAWTPDIKAVCGMCGATRIAKSRDFRLPEVPPLRQGEA